MKQGLDKFKGNFRRPPQREPSPEADIRPSETRSFVIKLQALTALGAASAAEKAHVEKTLEIIAGDTSINGVRPSGGAWQKDVRVLELNNVSLAYVDRGAEWEIFFLSFIGGEEPDEPHYATKPSGGSPRSPTTSPRHGHLAALNLAEVAESSWINGSARALVVIGDAANAFNNMKPTARAAAQAALQALADDGCHRGEHVGAGSRAAPTITVTINGVTITYVQMPDPMLVLGLSIDAATLDKPDNAPERRRKTTKDAAPGKLMLAGLEFEIALNALEGEHRFIASTGKAKRSLPLRLLRRRIWTCDNARFLEDLGRYARLRRGTGSITPTRIRVSVPAPWGSEALIDWLDAAIDVQELPGSPWLDIGDGARHIAAEALAREPATCLAALDVVLDGECGVHVTAKVLRARPAADKNHSKIFGQVWSVASRSWPSWLPGDVHTASQRLLEQMKAEGGSERRDTHVHAISFVALAEVASARRG